MWSHSAGFVWGNKNQIALHIIRCSFHSKLICLYRAQGFVSSATNYCLWGCLDVTEKGGGKGLKRSFCCIFGVHFLATSPISSGFIPRLFRITCVQLSICFKFFPSLVLLASNTNKLSVLISLSPKLVTYWANVPKLHYLISFRSYGSILLMLDSCEKSSSCFTLYRLDVILEDLNVLCEK